jgi:hypothetical protein
VSRISGFIQPTFGENLCLIDSYHPIQFIMGFEIGVPNNIVRISIILIIMILIIIIMIFNN